MLFFTFKIKRTLNTFLVFETEKESMDTMNVDTNQVKFVTQDEQEFLIGVNSYLVQKSETIKNNVEGLYLEFRI